MHPVRVERLRASSGEWRTAGRVPCRRNSRAGTVYEYISVRVRHSLICTPRQLIKNLTVRSRSCLRIIEHRANKNTAVFRVLFVWAFSQHSLDRQRNRATLQTKSKMRPGSDEALLTRCPYEADRKHIFGRYSGFQASVSLPPIIMKILRI